MTDGQILQKAYRRIFTDPMAKIVLADLVEFCFERKTTEIPDYPDVIHANEGRRAVLKHIEWRMGLTSPLEWAKAIMTMAPEDPTEKQEVADGTSEG